ncbi:hypothetical protein N9926_01130 [Flavobacteriaceae bacterium]|nr:hypothetical protein [Flavobacteriaceae bacterium]
MQDRHNEDGTRTDAALAKDYAGMGDVIELINCVINSTKVGGDGPFKDNLKYPEFETDEEKKAAVLRNVQHLEISIAYPDWKGDEDFTDANKAITDGKAYIG